MSSSSCSRRSTVKQRGAAMSSGSIAPNEVARSFTVRTGSSSSRLTGQIGQASTSPSPSRAEPSETMATELASTVSRPSTAGSPATRFAWSATPGG